MERKKEEKVKERFDWVYCNVAHYYSANRPNWPSSLFQSRIFIPTNEKKSEMFFDFFWSTNVQAEMIKKKSLTTLQQ